jgi:thiol:disulfide interchange protein
VYSLTLSGLLIFAFVLWLLWGLFTGRLVYRITGIEIAVPGLWSPVGSDNAGDHQIRPQVLFAALRWFKSSTTRQSASLLVLWGWALSRTRPGNSSQQRRRIEQYESPR